MRYPIQWHEVSYFYRALKILILDRNLLEIGIGIVVSFKYLGFNHGIKVSEA